MSKAEPDYKNTHFEFPELTRIHGQPTTADLITLKRQVRANASTVHTTLGGGHNGHLGLTCSPQVYNNVPNAAPYIRPNAPGALQVPAGATQFQIQQARDEHAEAPRVFKEVLAVERVLIQQIVAALDAKYIKALRDPITNKITRTIPQIFEHLFNAYGHVTPTELYELKQKVENMQFAPQEPIDTLVTEIDDLADIAEIAGSPITDRQRVDIGYIVLQRCKQYKTGLKEWNERAQADRTWNNFKNHFRDVQIALRKTGDLTIEEGLNHSEIINMVSEGVKAALEEHQIEEQAHNASETNSLKAQLNEMKEIIGKMNATQQNQNRPNQQQRNNRPQQMFPANPYLFQNPYPINPFEQQYHFQPHYQQFQPSQNTYFNRGNRGGRSYGGRGGRGGRGYVPRERKYCWTHGLCSHNGRECRYPAQGHQAEATLENRMGGNTNNISS